MTALPMNDNTTQAFNDNYDNITNDNLWNKLSFRGNQQKSHDDNNNNNNNQKDAIKLSLSMHKSQ